MKPYYERGGITIYCGDCLEIMPKLGVMFDAIIADLPYNTTELEWDTIIPFKHLWENYKRLVKDRGAVVLFGSQPFTSKLVMSNIEWFRYEIIYEKEKPVNIFQLKNAVGKSHENIIIFSPANITYNSLRMTYNPQGVENNNSVGKTYKYNAESIHNKRGITRKFSMGNKNYPRSILRYTNEYGNQRFHPTQKPLALLQYLIRTYTNKDEIILDNTMGSGTTLLAAQNEGRQAVGIELSESYCKIAVERLRQPSFFSIPDKPKKIEPKQLDLI